MDPFDLSRGLPGAASGVLPSGVALLDPAEAVFDGMLEGWRRQLKSRQLKESSIAPRLSLMRAFNRCTEQFPWQWSPADLEMFTSQCNEARNRYSTIRQKQNTIAMFCAFVTDDRYEWPTVCMRLFGRKTVQICHEWNTIAHTAEYEGDASRRPLTADELDRFFDCADERVARIRKNRRKGALAAFRSAVFYKTLYAFGIRNREGCRLDLSDFLPNPDHRAYGHLGALHVRWGKSSKGGPPRRRLVFLVPEVDWIVPVMRQYLDEVRPIYDPGRLPQLFLTEQHHRLQTKRVDEDFKDLIVGAGLPTELTPHCLRHTYATNLAEWDYDPMFIQHQLGHSYASTTAIYTHLGSDYKRQAIRSALSRAYGAFTP